MDLTQISLAEIVAEQIKRGGLRSFVRCFFPIVDAERYKANWHIDLICEHLEAVSRREIRRLVINVPPGCMKSMLVNVFWPAWEWATLAPGRKFMFASNDISLVLRDAQKMIQILQSELFTLTFPKFDLGGKVKSAHIFSNAHGGMRMSTSIGGKAIGWHVHTQVCDDPHKPTEISDKHLEAVEDWWTKTMATRASEPKSFARVIIMQRLHANDLSGRMLAEGYEHLCLPMRYEPRCQWDMGSSLNVQQSADPRSEGDLLWPERFDEESLALLEDAIGPTNVNSQLQQNPTPTKGGIINADWFETWPSSLLDTAFQHQWVQSWDFSSKGTDPSHSRVHGALWFVVRRPVEGDLYCLFDEIIGHWGYAESKRRFTAAQKNPRWAQARVKLIEEKANGVGIIDELKSEFGMTPTLPKDDKITRLIRHQPTFERRAVMLPPSETFAAREEFIDEIVKFPRGRYNDRVDTTTQFLDYATSDAARYAAALRKVRR